MRIYTLTFLTIDLIYHFYSFHLFQNFQNFSPFDNTFVKKKGGTNCVVSYINSPYIEILRNGILIRKKCACGKSYEYKKL